MKDKKKIILLGSIAIIVVIFISIAATYAFMRQSSSDPAITTMSFNSCTKIKLINTSSINLTNSYSTSRNVALQQNPYLFSISNT